MAITGSLLVTVTGTAVGLLAFGGQPVRAFLSGLGFLLAHFAAAIVHQLSHAVAARRTGHPMRAVRFGRWLILATSIYPPNEPVLPSDVHLRRAIGGPVGSLGFAGLCFAMALAVERWSPSLAFWLGAAAVDSLVIFTIGSMLPLGFTDMSTILSFLALDRRPTTKPRE